MKQSATSWLCPRPGDRERLLEMERRLARPRALAYVLVSAAAGVAAVRDHWWLGLIPAVSIAAYKLTEICGRRAGRPEYGVFTSLVAAQALAAVAVAVTGGPVSPMLALFIIPFSGAPARFTIRGLLAAMVLSVGLMFIATLAVDPHTFWQHPDWTAVTLLTLVCVSAFGVSVMRAEMDHRINSVVDPLTGLLNRKALVTRFPEIQHQASLTGAPLSMLVADLDHFKRINDTHGHDLGDAVLRDAAYTLRKSLKTFELAYRIGGEEFVVLLPGVQASDARSVAERLRQAIRACHPAGIQISMSFGVVTAVGMDASYEVMFKQADEALYEAKRAGRDRVVCAEAGQPIPAAECDHDPLKFGVDRGEASRRDELVTLP